MLTSPYTGMNYKILSYVVLFSVSLISISALNVYGEIDKSVSIVADDVASKYKFDEGFYEKIHNIDDRVKRDGVIVGEIKQDIADSRHTFCN